METAGVLQVKTEGDIVDPPPHVIIEVLPSAGSREYNVYEQTARQSDKERPSLHQRVMVREGSGSSSFEDQMDDPIFLHEEGDLGDCVIL